MEASTCMLWSFSLSSTDWIVLKALEKSKSHSAACGERGLSEAGDISDIINFNLRVNKLQLVQRGARLRSGTGQRQFLQDFPGLCDVER